MKSSSSDRNGILEMQDEDDMTPSSEVFRINMGINHAKTTTPRASGIKQSGSTVNDTPYFMQSKNNEEISMGMF